MLLVIIFKFVAPVVVQISGTVANSVKWHCVACCSNCISCDTTIGKMKQAFLDNVHDFFFFLKKTTNLTAQSKLCTFKPNFG